MTDFRLKTSYLRHPKIKKMILKFGPESVYHHLSLLSFTRENKPDGTLSGMDELDIAIACDITHSSNIDPEEFVHFLVKNKQLDENGGEYSIHDWADHNAFASANTDRSDTARFSRLKQVNKEAYNLLKKFSSHITKDEYKILVPLKGMPLKATINKLYGERMAIAGVSPAPSPSPSPSPTPSPTPTPTVVPRKKTGGETKPQVSKSNSSVNAEGTIVSKSSIYGLSKYPEVAKMKKPLTRGEYDKLTSKYGSDRVDDILGRMNNWKPLAKKNNSAYFTANNWILDDLKKQGLRLEDIDPNGSKLEFKPNTECSDTFLSVDEIGKNQTFRKAWYKWVTHLKKLGKGYAYRGQEEEALNNFKSDIRKTELSVEATLECTNDAVSRAISGGYKALYPLPDKFVEQEEFNDAY